MDLKRLPFGFGRRHGPESKHGGQLIAGAAALSALAAVVSGTGAYLFERAVRLRRRPLAARHQKAARILAAQSGAQLTTIEIASEDGTALRGWYFRAEPDERRAVLLLHGQGENRSAMLPYARVLLRHGYNCLCVDHRGHGESGGELASYGLKEALDVKLWVDCLNATQSQAEIYALGRSMGAAILLQALRYKPDLMAIVAEAPFASMREMAFDRIGQPVGAGSWLGRTVLRPMVESGFAYGRVRYGMDLGDAAPERALNEADVPVLLIHGDPDAIIPVRHASLLLEHCQGGVELWRVPGGGHCRALARQPEEFERRMCDWFRAPAFTG